MMKELLKGLFSILTIIFILGCTLSKPVINEIKWDIKTVQDLRHNTIYESLALYINCSDDDGDDDIETIYLIDHKNDLRWELEQGNREETDLSTGRWFGSSSIVMPDRRDIPRNKMRIFVRDRAGEYAESQIYITKSPQDKNLLDFPVLERENDKFKVKNYERVTILGFSNLGEHLYSGNLTSDYMSFKNIFHEDRRTIEPLEFYLLVRTDRDILESGPWLEPDYR